MSTSKKEEKVFVISPCDISLFNPVTQETIIATGTLEPKHKIVIERYWERMDENVESKE